MKKSYLFSLAILFAAFQSQAQQWSRIHTNLDSIWSTSVYYFNKGDTIIYSGRTGAMESTRRFYVSTDGGNNFTRDFTGLATQVNNPTGLWALKLSNKIIGFKNIQPNNGAYQFMGVDNWTSLVPQANGVFGEVNASTLFFQQQNDTKIYTVPASGGTPVQAATNVIELYSTYTRGTRVFLGGKQSMPNFIMYVDNGNFSSIQPTSITPAITTNNDVVTNFFENAGGLYAVLSDGITRLYKSTDNGLNWNLVQTTHVVNGNSQNLSSYQIIGTPDGRIFFVEAGGNSDDVYLSTDGGLTASKIGNGLPASITPFGKLMVKGNKVWYDVKAVSMTDFVTTDVSMAGLYLLDAQTNGIEENVQETQVHIYPNPASDMIHLEVESGKVIESIRIVDLKGALMLETTSTDISVSNLNAGVYLALVQCDKGLLIKKLLVKQ
ncbi:T9SS type A sorting domain-containing protein [Fluviicola sp.]|uniref:T9SS type A sorting domain-containing protein n=1 Tax=Fluviicola sp. TaxID=1917219 RepID=UPI0031DD1A16